MQLNPYLTFKGQCEEAFKFYAQCLGGTIQMSMTFGDSPMADQVPSEWRDKIVHATLLVGTTAVGGSDAPPDRYEPPKGISNNDPAQRSGKSGTHISIAVGRRNGDYAA